MGAVVKCAECGNWYTLTETGPIRCPICTGDEDKLPLNHNDRKFLKSIRIKPDDD